VSAFFGGCEKKSAIFLIAFSGVSYEQNNREKKKTEEKKPTFFVMSPDGLFGKQKPCVF
jgi:hypothetical protein